MRTATAHGRAHHIRLARRDATMVRAGCVLAALCMISCGEALPRPAAAPASTADYLPVPFPPRHPPVEFVPPSPAKDAVWVDGTWEWTGVRYVWRFGAWVVPAPGARHAHWVIVRRNEDGQLFFAPSSWRDAAGNRIDDRAMNQLGARFFGARGRARSRPGASASSLPELEETSPEETGRRYEVEEEPEEEETE